MKKILLSVVFSFLVFSFSFAQAPVIEWEKCLGGTAIDDANSIEQTNDGDTLLGVLLILMMVM